MTRSDIPIPRDSSSELSNLIELYADDFVGYGTDSMENGGFDEKGYTEHKVSFQQSLQRLISQETATERLETAETIRQDIEHTTECNCCANGSGEHDFYAHLRIIDRYIEAERLRLDGLRKEGLLGDSNTSGEAA